MSADQSVRCPFPQGNVVSVNRSIEHEFSKCVRPSIQLVTGLGVEGDAHFGVTVQHRSRVAKDPTQPNLRQVHLIHQELIDELRRTGFRVGPGSMGENITTLGLDLLGLPRGTRLRLGESAVVEITGLRNPCRQLNTYQAGLMSAVMDRDDDGNLVLKAGIMGVVLAGGEVRRGDPIYVDLPLGPHERLQSI